MKKINILAVFLLLSIVVISGCVQQVPPTGAVTSKLIVTAKDKPVKIDEIGNVTELILTIKSVQVHFKQSELEKIKIEAEIEDNKTKVETRINGVEEKFELDTNDKTTIINEISQRTGLSRSIVEKITKFEEEVEAEETDEIDVEDKSPEWVTVLNETKTIDLLRYSDNVSALLGEVNVPVGAYTQIRLYIESATISIDGVVYNLTIPSKVLKLVNEFEVRENKTEVLILDFDVQHSVAKDGQGYKLKPVIKIDEKEYEEHEIDEPQEKEREGIKEVEESNKD